MKDYNKIYFMDRFNKTVAETPNNRVLVDAFHPEGYTRKELDELSGKVYTYLKENGVGKNDFVMIYMPRTVDIFVAALGVLKAGAFFTIMEDHYPRERVEFMKQNANCKLELNADTLKEAYDREPTEGYVTCDMHDPAFIIFTSGSTGNPKGIIHEYGNIGHIMNSVVYPDCEGMKEFGLVAPTNFIATILLYMVALSDETIDIHLLSYDIVKNPKKLAEYVVTKGVTHTFVSPSMMRVTNNLIGIPLKLIITGSEPATNVYNPNTPVMNFYCMSESGFCISQFIIDKPYKNCPIGKCETGAHEIMLLKEDGTKVTEQGDIGEICVTNPYVRGYIGLPDETRKTFADGIMHTNDLGRFDENGNLVYVGRANDMVKINGNRIEPAEIEAVGKEVLGIDWCAAKGFVEQNSYIALYYKEDITFDEEEVRKKMEEKLPYYMIPTYFIKIDEVPLTATGKFNRKALPKPAAKVNFAEYVAPTNEMEEKLCNAFAKVLNLQRVGINDDFYQLGGDSLTSMQVMGEINSDYLTAEDLFKGRTAAKTAELYYENEKESGGTPWTETEMDSRKKEFELTGVQKSYVEEMLREEGKLSADISRLIELPLAIGAEKICAGMNMMVRNRPIWGTVFFKNDEGKLMQKFDESKVPTVQVEKMTQEEFEKIKHDLVPVYEPFDNILGSARVIETEEHIYAFISMSHAKVDGFAARKFFGDILDLYRGKELELDSYYSVLEKNRKDKMSSGYEEAKGYNDDRYGKDDWLRCLPGDGDGVDHKRAFDGRPLSFTIEDIEKAETRLGASRNEIFAAITLVAISKMTGNLKPMINWTYQDRGDNMKQNACGLVMKRLPIAVNVMAMSDLSEGLENIKDQILKGMAYSSYEWICENENDLTDDVMSFVYQPYGIMDTSIFSSIGARLVEDALPRIGTARRCAFMVVEQKDNVIGLVNYMEGFYSKEYIDKFHGIYNAVASEVIKGGQ